MSDNNNARRSLPRRAAKRKAEEELKDEGVKKPKQGVTDHDDVAPSCDSHTYRWIGDGTELPNGQVEHTLLEMTLEGKTSIITVGDTILLRSGEDADRDQAFVAKVERMWQIPPKKNTPREYCMKIRVRWFFKKMDVQQLKGSCAGPLTKQQLLSTISNRDLLLSNQYDENDVVTVLDKCIVVNRRPGEEMPLNAVRPGVYVSRYSISFGETPGVSVLTAYDGENQPWPDELIDGAVADKSDGDQKDLHERTAGEAVDDGTARPQRSSSRDNSVGEADTDGTFEESGSETGDVRLSEGANTKGKIQIGPDHQANLGPIDLGQPVVSREPQLIWLKEAGAAVDMDKYLEEAAEILHQYLGQKKLLTQEPYFPLPEEKMQELLKELKLPSMTLSNLSTGSSMSKRRNRLTRECKLDKLIELLHTKEYNVEEALKAIVLSPESYVTVWSKAERDLFDNGFRRYSGSLRMIAENSVFVSKNFKDVVDFHYRFMIPSQFRRLQDKKREHAVRMMEIIENRRSIGSTTIPRDESRRRAPLDGQKGKTDWSKTGVSDVVGVVEERRSSAKDLLLDIQQAVGTEKAKHICRAIKSLRSKSISELKGRAVEILRSHPTLLDRFLDYLPQRYRC